MKAIPFNVQAIIDEIINIEAGYVNHPDDRGGPTCWGITQKVARAKGYQGLMSELPKSVAEAIYAEDYFFKPKLDKIYAESYLVAEEVMDTGVNIGMVKAVKFLQTALNSLNTKQALYPDVKVDGLVGSKTVSALEKYLDIRGSKGETILLTILNCLQGHYYVELSQKRETDESFIYGWFSKRVVLKS